MHHVAIMNPQWKLIPKILSREKTIESRWYQTRRAPWNRIKKGDTIFFKDSGKQCTAHATVSKVLYIELSTLADVKRVIRTYGKQLCLVEINPRTWGKTPHYCILMWLSRPRVITKPFAINKKGFGAGSAWITVQNINTLQKG